MAFPTAIHAAPARRLPIGGKKFSVGKVPVSATAGGGGAPRPTTGVLWPRKK